MPTRDETVVVPLGAFDWPWCLGADVPQCLACRRMLCDTVLQQLADLDRLRPPDLHWRVEQILLALVPAAISECAQQMLAR